MKLNGISTLVLLCFALFLPSCTSPELQKPAAVTSAPKELKHDQARFQQIRAILDSQRDALRGIPFEQFTSILGIKNDPWDENYTNQPFHSRRTYHLGEFFLDISIEHKDDQLFTDSHFYPGLHADGLTRQERLNEQQKKLGEYFGEKAARHERALEQSRLKKDIIQQPSAGDAATRAAPEK